MGSNFKTRNLLTALDSIAMHMGRGSMIRKLPDFLELTLYLSEKFFNLTAFQYLSDNPIVNIEIDGLE